MPEVSLLVGSTAYGGWKSIDVTRSIEQIAGRYQLAVSEVAPDGSAARDIVEGAKAQVMVDGEPVITGYVDDVDISHNSSQHEISVSGRDAAGDLVDCGAVYKTGQWTNQGMLAIASDLCRPFGISVTADTDLGKSFAKWNIEPGETVFENLDRMSRHRGVLVVSDGIGGVLLTQAGKERAPTKIVLGQNILSGQAIHSFRERFSEYVVLGQKPLDDSFDFELATQVKGTAKDGAVLRYRPSVEVIEDFGDTDTLRTRAAWRRNVNAGRGTRTVIVVQGWQHESGLWEPNTRVTVTDAALRLRERELLIVQVRYMLDSAGTRAELTMTFPEALTAEALPEREEEEL